MIGKKIKEFRKKNNLTIRELANKSSVSASYISDLESVGKKKPSLDVLSKIATALNISVSELIEENSSFAEIIDSLDDASPKINTNYTYNSKKGKNFDKSIEKFRRLSFADKEDFLTKLSKDKPFSLLTNDFLSNFDNFTKEDLINLCSEICLYYISSLIELQNNTIPDIKYNYDKLSNISKLLLKSNESKSNIIEENEKIIKYDRDIINTLKDLLIKQDNLIKSNYKDDDYENSFNSLMNTLKQY